MVGRRARNMVGTPGRRDRSVAGYARQRRMVPTQVDAHNKAFQHRHRHRWSRTRLATRLSLPTSHMGSHGLSYGSANHMLLYLPKKIGPGVDHGTRIHRFNHPNALRVYTHDSRRTGSRCRNTGVLAGLVPKMALMSKRGDPDPPEPEPVFTVETGEWFFRRVEVATPVNGSRFSTTCRRPCRLLPTFRWTRDGGSISSGLSWREFRHHRACDMRTRRPRVRMRTPARHPGRPAPLGALVGPMKSSSQARPSTRRRSPVPPWSRSVPLSE